MKGYIFLEKVTAVELGTVIGYVNEPCMKKTDLFYIYICISINCPQLAAHLGKIISFFTTGL